MELLHCSYYMFNLSNKNYSEEIDFGNPKEHWACESRTEWCPTLQTVTNECKIISQTHNSQLSNFGAVRGFTWYLHVAGCILSGWPPGNSPTGGLGWQYVVSPTGSMWPPPCPTLCGLHRWHVDPSAFLYYTAADEAATKAAGHHNYLLATSWTALMLLIQSYLLVV